MFVITQFRVGTTKTRGRKSHFRLEYYPWQREQKNTKFNQCVVLVHKNSPHALHILASDSDYVATKDQPYITKAIPMRRLFLRRSPPRERRRSESARKASVAVECIAVAQTQKHK